MRVIFSVFVLCWLPALLFPQHIYTLGDDAIFADSLTRLIEGTPSDSSKCINAYKLATLYGINKKQDLSETYQNLANTISERSNSAYLKHMGMFYNAYRFISKGDVESYTQAMVNVNKLLKPYHDTLALIIRAQALKNLSVLFQIKQEEAKAMRVLLTEAIPLAKQSGNAETLAHLYKMVAVLFINLNEPDKANKYLEQAVKLIGQGNRRSFMLNESKIEIYTVYAENAVAMGKFQAAKAVLDKSFAILKKYPNSNLNGCYYYSLGYFFHKQNQFNKAIENYNKGIEKTQLYGDRLSLTRIQFAKYKSLYALNCFTEARDILIQMEAEGTYFAQDKKNNYKEIMKCCEKIGDVKNGYLYAQKYIQLSDSLYEVKREKEVLELETKYNAVEKEKQIVTLKAQHEQAQLKAENERLNSFLLTVLALFFLVALFFLWKNYKSQKKIAAQQQLNHKQQLEALDHQKNIEVMQAIITTEELERKRIARDLHDGIGSRLSALKMKVADVKGMSENPNDMAAVTNLLNMSISELRQVAYNLLPEALLKLGLENALQDLCDSLKSESVRVNFHANQLKNDIIEAHQIVIYRIVQELVNNALKHAQCTEILVDCSQNGSLVLLAVEDNGLGYSNEKIKATEGLGLKNLKNRVEMLNGKMDIISEVGKGTSVNIELNIQLKS